MSKGITNSMEMQEPFYVRRRPDPIPLRKFLYNKEKGTVMGRTGVSWGKQLASLSAFYWEIEQVAHFNTHTRKGSTSVCCMLNHNTGVVRCLLLHIFHVAASTLSLPLSHSHVHWLFSWVVRTRLNVCLSFFWSGREQNIEWKY